MNKFKITIDGNNYDVTINTKDQNTANVEVNGISYEVHYEHPYTIPVALDVPKPKVAASPKVQPTPQASHPISSGSASSIKAPLPGTITAIKVSVGDQVKRGDILLVMEAMKMENNIMANKDGQVKTIHISPGQTVAQDATLIDLA